MRQQRVAIGKRIVFSLFREVQKVFYIKTFFVASGRIRLRSFIEHLFDSPCPYKLSLALCAVTNFAPTRILYFLFYRPTPLTFIKLILIKESISLNAFIKKTFTISDLASLAAPSYVVRLPLYNHPFRGRQASEVHRSLENLLGRLFFNLWRLRSSLSFHHRNLSFDSFRNHTQTPSAPEVEYPKRMSCDRF